MSDHLNDEAFFGALQAPATYGNSAASELARTLGGLLGAGASAAAAPMLRDPEVQQAIADATEECKVRAKEGVDEWMQENWHLLALGASAILAGHWVLTTIALRLAFPRAAFQGQGSPES
jgi:hypothetical protein